MAAAEFAPLEVGVLLRIGTGTPSEVATFPIPLRAELDYDTSIQGMPQLYVRLDLDVLHEGLRAALIEAADTIPQAWEQSEEERADREAMLARWDAERARD